VELNIRLRRSEMSISPVVFMKRLEKSLNKLTEEQWELSTMDLEREEKGKSMTDGSVEFEPGDYITLTAKFRRVI
jgi:hypothetical protein